MSSKTRTILIGTSDFAEKIFSKLKDAGCPSIEIVGVVTATDKPIGRKQVIAQSPVKLWAQKNNLPLVQPENINSLESVKQIKKISPDLIITTAYGQIISKEILDIPAKGVLNIHPSILPKYRGASPIQATILNGDRETGVTIMLMDKKMDHGEIISNSQFSLLRQGFGGQAIFNKPDHQELSDKLADLGADLLIKTLPDYITGKIKPVAQNHSQTTFTKIINKKDGQIDWRKSAVEIERQIRALSTWPQTFTYFNSKQLKILQAKIDTKKTDYSIGQVFLDEDKNLKIQTGEGSLILQEVQLEGKKTMTAKEFLNGNSAIINYRLQ